MRPWEHRAAAFVVCTISVIATAVTVLAGACQRSAVPAAGATAVSRPVADAKKPAPSDEAPRWPSQAGGPRLPEDPAAGKHSEAEWQAHLNREDRERLLARDRHAMKHHEAIVAMLVRASRAFERARNERAVRAAEKSVEKIAVQVEKRLTKINVWGNVSPLTETYRLMLRWLKEDFPRERRATLAGAGDGGKALRAEWARRLAEIRSFLHEAAESEGEGE